MTETSTQMQRGFTLVELMISMVLFSFAVAGLLSVGVSITRGYGEQRQAVEAEAAARIPLDFLSDALRQASPGVSVPANLIDATTCVAGSIAVVNSATAPDELILMYASGAIVTSTREVYAGTSTVLVNDATQFAAGDHVIFSDYTNGVLMSVTAVNTATNQLTLASPCSLTWPAYNGTTGFPINSLVIRAQYARFFIQDLDGIPTLWMDPDVTGPLAAQPLAEGIEDMQIAVGVDANPADGSIAELGTGANDDEWIYNYVGETLAAGSTIRAVRVTLTARATKAKLGVAAYYRPTAEDRTGTSTADQYRRRVLRSIVDLRNIGGSP
jgi:prepilin-type N-terminal cleavage/methylation domain-containing protein